MKRKRSDPQAGGIATGVGQTEPALSTQQASAYLTRGFNLRRELRALVAEGATGHAGVPAKTLFFLADEAAGRLIGLAAALVDSTGKTVHEFSIFDAPESTQLQLDLVDVVALSTLRYYARDAHTARSCPKGFEVVAGAAERQGVPNPLDSLDCSEAHEQREQK
ncbi:MAG: hypothetical protein M1608_02170 [Candidatus Omnitrophica bacterium]|nr:hypothetical protein [Candidatus Omnitrophota bacterium]